MAGVTAESTSSGSTRPSGPTPTMACERASAQARTLSCSTASVTTWPSVAANARLLASVAPAVKVTLPGRAPMQRATVARAASTSARTERASA